MAPVVAAASARSLRIGIGTKLGTKYPASTCHLGLEPELRSCTNQDSAAAATCYYAICVYQGKTVVVIIMSRAQEKTVHTAFVRSYA